MEGIEGSYDVDEEIQREGVLATIASIIGIASGALTIAEQIRKWYQEYKQGKSGKKIAKVLIVGRNGDRLISTTAKVKTGNEAAWKKLEKMRSQRELKV